MAVTVTQIKKDVFLHKASHLYYTPWIKDATNGWQPGTSTYDIVDILADTISIEQADPETETIDWEFGDSPLMSSSTKGERTIAASCVDMSFDILEHVFGWARKKSGDSDVMVAETTSSEDSFATMVVTFHGDSTPIIILPKVSMSSKTTIGTLKTSTGQADLSGTAQVGYISYNSTTATTEMAIINPTVGKEIQVSNSESNPLQDIGKIAIADGEISITDTEAGA